MRQCIFVVGTRMQLVKISPVLRLAHETGLRHVVWYVGQHHDSVDDLISDFGLESTFELPAKRRQHSSIAGLLVWIPSTAYRIFQFVSSVKVWTGKRPLVVVNGDTLSTWLGAIAGRWGGGDVVHLESGLSSGKWNDPFPEELLRRLIFRKSRYAICPSNEAAARMSLYPGCIVVNSEQSTSLDCVRYAMANRSRMSSERNYFVASIHRFSNIHSRAVLTHIVAEMKAAASFGEVHFILHPATELRLEKYGMFDALSRCDGIRMSQRMPYTQFLSLIGGARAVFSDGDSDQQELAYLGVPTILYRERSEISDGLGTNIRLRAEIEESMETFIANGSIDALRTTSRLDAAVRPSQQIVDALKKWAGAESG